MIDASRPPAEVGSALFYRQLEPLSLEDHGSLGVSPLPAPYAFLQGTSAVPLTADEFQYAAICYPIVFASQSKVPLALMGPRDGINVFIAPDGEMDPDAYVPAFALRYPFLPVSPDRQQDPLGGGGRMVLCIDRQASNISDRPEIPFFENGEHSPFTRKAIDACRKFEELAGRTRDLIRILADYDLFEELELRIPRANPDGTETEPEKVEDCLTISERKLSLLPAETYLKLRERGIIGLAYAQLLSLGLWPKLLSRAARMNAVQA